MTALEAIMSRKTKRTHGPVDDSQHDSSGSPTTGLAGRHLDEEARLTNRVALLTFLTAFALIATLVAVPKALEGGAGAPWRLLSLLPPAAGLGLLLSLRRARAALRAFKRPERGSPLARSEPSTRG